MTTWICLGGLLILAACVDGGKRCGAGLYCNDYSWLYCATDCQECKQCPPMTSVKPQDEDCGIGTCTAQAALAMTEAALAMTKMKLETTAKQLMASKTKLESVEAEKEKWWSASLSLAVVFLVVIILLIIAACFSPSSRHVFALARIRKHTGELFRIGSGLQSCSIVQFPTWPPMNRRTLRTVLKSQDLKPSTRDTATADYLSIQYQWCQNDGTYVNFDKYENLDLERWMANKKDSCEIVIRDSNRAIVVDFLTMTYHFKGRSEKFKFRRVMDPEEVPVYWDHQDPGDGVGIYEVPKGTSEHTRIVSCIFQVREGSITKETCEIKRIRRVQNPTLLRRYNGEKAIIVKGRQGLEERHLFHGPSKTHPQLIAADAEGFMVEYGRANTFYGKGCYFAELPRYSHEYAFHSEDEDGKRQNDSGSFYHFLVVQVLVGKSKEEKDPWSDDKRGHQRSQREEGVLNLGKNFDSVKGGPHRPSWSGAGKNDSIMYVVYKSAQTLPEYWITYQMKQPES